MSSQTFAGLGASRAVIDALAARGIHEPFPVQRLVIPDVLDDVHRIARGLSLQREFARSGARRKGAGR